MAGDFAVEVTKEGTLLDRAGVEKLRISAVEGRCAADLDEPSRPREVGWYVENVLKPLIASGEINDGSKTKFDDRKLRLDSTSVSGGVLTIGFGATHYGAFRADLDRDPAENVTLQDRGAGLFDDKFAFFSRPPGVAGLVFSSDGSIFIGERLSGSDDSGKLNAVAGQMDYRADPTAVKLEDDLFREAKEEFGLGEKDIERVQFVGGYLHPNRGDMDFSYLVFSKQPDAYFSSGDWMKKVSEQEHKGLVRLASHDEVQVLLDEGRVPENPRRYELMYSTRGALQSVRSSELAE